MTRIAVSGASGRMGRTLIEAINTDGNSELVHAFEQPSCDQIGMDAGAVAGLTPLNVLVTDSIDGPMFDVLIEFTTPSATLSHLQFCRQHRRCMVIGTTGLAEEQQVMVKAASKDIAILQAPNMSAGINLILKLLQVAAQALGDSVDVEVIEAHHRHKVDAPSGTALRMGEVVAEALGRDLDTHGVFARHGRTGAREPKTIGFSTIRASDIVGEHTVMFAGPGERIEITHRATSRMTFAAGAVRAANWIIEQPPGLYDVQDLLGLN